MSSEHRTIVRFDADLSSPPRGVRLPDPRGKRTIPTAIYRRDVGEWVMPTVWTLREGLLDDRIETDWTVWPTPLGNMAFTRLGIDDCGRETGWYVGFFDLVTGDVVLYDGSEERLHELSDNYPFDGLHQTVGFVEDREASR